MKATIYDKTGSKKGELEMPKLFSQKIREDIVQKYLEASKFKQPYAPDEKAGRKHSASGTISHKRHDWKGHYGRGISRIPRKTMWRRGTQFFWIGAEVSGTRGGRRAHGPKGIGKEKKINRKEAQIAMQSGFAATANTKYIVDRYATLDKLDVTAPVVVDSLEKVKTKELMSMLEKVFGKAITLVTKQKTVRPGKGKTRGRKYKSNAGLLLIKTKDEHVKAKRVEVKNIEDVTIADLYPLGRLTMYTEKAVKVLGGKQ